MQPDNQTEKRVIALGFFDGVHLGHGALLRRVAEMAERLDAVPAAVTFDTHPENLILKRVRQSRLLIGNHTGNDAYDSIGHHGSCQFAARQHIVADAHLFRNEVLANAVVDALKVAAQDDEVLRQRQEQ